MIRYNPNIRAAFGRQPAQYLLFDVGQPMTSTQMHRTIMVLFPFQHTHNLSRNILNLVSYKTYSYRLYKMF
jgi:hypothetical protein